jgi:NAD-dependent deacetylase
MRFMGEIATIVMPMQRPWPGPRAVYDGPSIMTCNLVILTGAGISKESGLETFREAGGIWSQVRVEDVATPEGFARDRALVHEFYNLRRRRLLAADVAPNPAHLALARLEQRWTASGAGDFLLVTQNIDDLHERAGSERIVHMHGEMLKARCLACEAVLPWRDDLSAQTSCPACGMAGDLRPHVVWFGEIPFEMDRVFEALGRADLFLSIGTSGNVYPASAFVELARAAGAHTVELNLEPSEGADFFAEALHGPASEVVPFYVERLLDAAEPACS